MPQPRLLGVLLCYNDGDILADALQHLLNEGHDIVVWNHGSTDDTADVLERFRPELREITLISRDVDFHDLYPLMSKHLMTQYVPHYDWISWPDQDEILEGPNRAASYRAYLEEVMDSRHSWIEFNDFVYWFTEADDPAIASPCARVRHYSLARHGPPKIRSWRASATNIRWFNHNRTDGTGYPRLFNLRHYPMRSVAGMQRRLSTDRANLQHGPINFHYENMKKSLSTRAIRADDLHADDGTTDLDPSMKFNWKDVYGSGPTLPRDVTESYVLSTKRWEIATVLKVSLARLPAAEVSAYGRDRIDRWLQALDQKISCPVVVTFKKDDVKIVTEELSRAWASNPQGPEALLMPSPSRRTEIVFDSLPVSVWADSATRSVRVEAGTTSSGTSPQGDPLFAMVPCYGGDVAHIARLEGGAAEFDQLRSTYYYLTCEPLSLHTR